MLDTRKVLIYRGGERVESSPWKAGKEEVHKEMKTYTVQHQLTQYPPLSFRLDKEGNWLHKRL